MGVSETANGWRLSTIDSLGRRVSYTVDRRTSLVGEIALTLPGSLKVANHSTLSAMASAPTLPHPWENRC